MDGDSKKSLKIEITEFYKLNSSKGKEHTGKSLSEGLKSSKNQNQNVVIKMFENLKTKGP